jgi:hypothetical protein
MISLCLQHKVALKIQSKKVKLNDWKFKKWTAELFKLNDLKYNFITYAKQSILSDQNYGIAFYFPKVHFGGGVENFGYFVERNFEAKKTLRK